jgi:hypothetical protein
MKIDTADLDYDSGDDYDEGEGALSLDLLPFNFPAPSNIYCRAHRK